MVIIKLLRYIIGYVSFNAYGGFPERFVNLCTKNHIPLWNMKRKPNCFSADTTIGGYKEIRQSAHRSGVKVCMAKKHGLPFFFSQNRMRRGIIAGLGLAAVIVALLSTMVWSVNVQGNTTVSDEKILETFALLGLKPGVRRSKINTADIADEAEKQLDGVAWASVNIIGSRAEIVISESTKAPQFPQTEKPCNIVACEDAVITKIEANIGKEAVKPGDIVLKGDLLISGVTENLDKTQTLKAARGKVLAHVTKTASSDINGNVFCQSIEKTRYIIYLFGLKIPLGVATDEENRFVTESYLSDGDIKLPLGIIKEHSYSATNETQLPPELEKLYKAKRFSENFRKIYCENNVLSGNFSVNGEGEETEFYGVYECEKDIGITSEIFIEKN